MSTEQDSIPDTYRTPGSQAEPPEPSVCYDCKHARNELRDSHASYWLDNGHVIQNPHLLRCALAEERSTESKCFVSGHLTRSVATAREWCDKKNKKGDCEKFVRYVRPRKPTPPNVPSTDIEMAVEPVPVVRDIPWVPISLGAGVVFGLLLMMFT